VGIRQHMWKKVEIVVDSDLIHEAIRRYRLADAREAVHLALRTLLAATPGAAGGVADDEYDEFSDLSAWEPRRHDETG
jgi:Arc/MetJ family transcription regulator